MSTHQQTKPRRANQSITDECGRPGTTRSKVGCDAIDEPCTNNTAGLPSGLPTYFSHRNRRTSPLFVQCSTPVTGASWLALGVVMSESVYLGAGLADNSCPALALGAKEGAEFGRCRADHLDAGAGHVVFHVRCRQRGDDFALQPVDDRGRRAGGREQSHPDVSLVS